MQCVDVDAVVLPPPPFGGGKTTSGEVGRMISKEEGQEKKKKKQTHCSWQSNEFVEEEMETGEERGEGRVLREGWNDSWGRR